MRKSIFCEGIFLDNRKWCAEPVEAGITGGNSAKKRFNLCFYIDNQFEKTFLLVLCWFLYRLLDELKSFTSQINLVLDFQFF